MSTITVATTKSLPDDSHFWEAITDGDDGSAVKVLGGKYACGAYGNFAGSADLAFQYSPDGTNGYFEISGASFLAAGHLVFEVPDGYIKPVMGSGNGSTDVDAWLKAVRTNTI
jgi:hypothetical protein